MKFRKQKKRARRPVHSPEIREQMWDEAIRLMISQKTDEHKIAVSTAYGIMMNP